jgi:hypothetical protein
MELSDGLILGVYNYCDRRCERCPLTGRCRVFADRAEDEFERDHGAIVEPRRERMARQIEAAIERWEKELGLDFKEIQREAMEELENSADPDAMFEVSLEHLELETRGRDFSSAVWKWLESIPEDQYRASEPLQVLGHFWIFVAGKIYRALMGLKDDFDHDRSDAPGIGQGGTVGLGRDAGSLRGACCRWGHADEDPRRLRRPHCLADRATRLRLTAGPRVRAARS